MPMKFFAIPALDPSGAEEELNRFLRGHRTVSLTRQLVTAEVRAVWCVAIEYLDGVPQRIDAATGADPGRKNRVDYKDVLNPADFALFSKLREVRKQLAEADGLPVYAVFTNEQMAQVAQLRPRTPSALQAIEGIGEAKTARYGARLLEVVEPKVEPAPALV